ncbi:MAG: hypothetical protein WCW14_03225, partial [Candidatus Paceibacterota bacterium]
MYNLLPDYKRKEVKREYHLRFLLGFLLALSITGVVAVLTILPSYFLSNVKISTTTTELDSLKK